LVLQREKIGKRSEILSVKMPDSSFLLLQFVIIWSMREAVFEVHRVGFIINWRKPEEKNMSA
jgi:hypothetical protein